MLQTHGLEPGWQLLVTLHQQLDQILDKVAILVVEEGGGEAEVAHATSSTNPVHVLLHVSRQVKVDDVLHVGDVQTTSSDSGGHDDRSLTSFKSIKITIVLLQLSTIGY